MRKSKHSGFKISSLSINNAATPPRSWSVTHSQGHQFNSVLTAPCTAKMWLSAWCSVLLLDFYSISFHFKVTLPQCSILTCSGTAQACGPELYLTQVWDCDGMELSEPCGPNWGRVARRQGWPNSHIQTAPPSPGRPTLYVLFSDLPLTVVQCL